MIGNVLSEPDQWLLFLGRFHPVVVHLPFGLLLGGCLIELIAWRRKREAETSMVLQVLLGAGLVSALLSIALGQALAGSRGHDTPLLADHRQMGIWVGALGSFAFLASWLRSHGIWRRAASAALRVQLALLACLLLLTGHYGGQLTHGSGFLTQHLPKSLRQLPLLGSHEQAPLDTEHGAPEDPLWESKIQLMLAENCLECHGQEKAKAGLRLDRISSAYSKAASGKRPIVPGDAMASELVRRITLEPGHVDSMPPSGRGRLSPEHILSMIDWINSGARDRLPIPAPPTPAIAPEALAALQAAGARMAALAEGSRQLSVDFRHAATPPTPGQLRLLSEAAQQVIELNLRSTLLTDKHSAFLEQMQRLERLDLSETAIGDATLDALKGLPNLRFLNLYGTEVSDQGCLRLAEFSNLECVVLTSSKASSTALQQLRTLRPELEVIERSPQLAEEK